MTTLTDDEIGAVMSRGGLIRNGDVRQLAGACYELRMGNVYYDLTEGDQPIALAAGQEILIKPGHRVVLITYEELAVPNDVLARVVSKGSLFSVGLSPVATYADPGFSGQMGVVTQNISDRYILLPQLVSIAKVDFTKLSGPVAHPYQGQHGYQTHIWPIKHQLQKRHDEVASDPRVGSEKAEAYRLMPQATAKVLQALERRRRLVDGAIVVGVIMNAAALFAVQGKFVDNILGLVGNLVASVIVALVVFYTNQKD